MNSIFGEALRGLPGPILVTGHTGFKGTWLTLLLEYLNIPVVGISLPPENNSLYSLMERENKITEKFIDIRNLSDLQGTIQKFTPSAVLHMAAQPLVLESYESPISTFEVNVIGSANLLQSCLSTASVKTVGVITTDKVYRNHELPIPYREDDPLGGYDPYSASKAASEMVIDSYVKSFFNPIHIPIGIGRAGNVIGGGDWSNDRLIPDIAKALNTNKEVVIRNPKAVRPWQHVIEPLFGYLELGLKLNIDPIKYAQAYNFGPNTNDALSVEEMVVKSINCWASGTYNVEVNSNNPHEAGLLKLDITKATTELNWKPVLNAQTAVELTINWYKKYYNNTTATKLMESDIKYYQSKINE